MTSKKWIKSEPVKNKKGEIIGFNIYYENGEIKYKPYLYNDTPLMKLLGEQFTCDEKTHNEIMSIAESYYKCGNGIEKLIAQLVLQYHDYSMLENVYKLGVIHGIRKERLRRKKGD